MALLAGDSMPLPVWMSKYVGIRSAALISGSLLGLWSLINVSRMLLISKMERQEQLGRSMLRLPGRVELVMQVMILSLFALQLTIGGWAYLVCEQLELRRYILLDELMLLAPYLAMLLIKWHCFYPVNRHIKEYITAGQLSMGMAARPVWSRREYMSFQLRHGLLIILAPLMIILAYKDVIELLTRYVNRTGMFGMSVENVELISNLFVMAGGAAVFLFSPLLLRHVWLTRPLPQGPLREKLETFCRRIGLRYREILLWETYSSSANAAVMGVIPQVRYVLLSDALIENMPDEQIKAVFGHEAGHVHHKHIMFLVLFVVGFGSSLLLALEFLGRLIGGRLGGYEQWAFNAACAATVFLWLGAFGFVSRKFERQADVYGAMTAGAVEGAESDGVASSVTLSKRGSAAMASALQRISLLNGIAVDTRSWRHSSIGSRMTLLQDLAIYNGRLKRFGAIVSIIKILVAVIFILSIVGWRYLEITQVN